MQWKNKIQCRWERTQRKIKMAALGSYRSSDGFGQTFASSAGRQGLLSGTKLTFEIIHLMAAFPRLPTQQNATFLKITDKIETRIGDEKVREGGI